MKYFLKIYLFILIFLPLIAQGDLDNETVVFTVESFPPYHVRSPDGEIVGLHKNLADELFARAGIKLRQVKIPYARALAMIKQGKMGMLQTEDSRVVNGNDEYLFPVPGAPIELKLWVSNKRLPLLTKVEEYPGYSFAVIRGWPLGPLDAVLNQENKNLTLISRNSPTSALKMLTGNRVDYLVTYLRPFNFAKQIMKVDDSKFRSHSIYKSNGYSFGIPRQYPYAEELYTRIKAEYDKMVANGEIDTDYIMLKGDDPNQYFYESEDPE